VSFLSSIRNSTVLNNRLLRKYTAVVGQDLSATYSRDIQKWLLVAPIIGVVSGLAITALTLVILNVVWGFLLPYYLHHHWAILLGLLLGFLLTGLIMRYRTPDPDQHTTEEIINSYHEHHGDVNVRPFWWKMLAAITTIGSGGSAALEGPSIYAGGAIGSWLWTKLTRLGLDAGDRRIMLISGAAAGMGAVFRAPLTGLIFAIEVPYKDDLAHEALLPSLLASVVAYATLASIVGATPIFGFVGSTRFAAADLIGSALLGLLCGVIAMVFAITFQHARRFAVNLPIPHPVKLLIGGFLTAVCGIIFVEIYGGPLIPLGPNYEAVGQILKQPHGSGQLAIFAGLKLAATLFSLGSGGVSAMFVPLFLVGGAIGKAFAQTIIHAPHFDLYAAVGMACFIAAGYKTPLAAVVFVAETTGGHSYLIPSLIGVAIAYAVSGEASVSADQRVREVLKLAELTGARVHDVMQRQVFSVPTTATLREFADSVAAHHRHAIFPVYEEDRAIGTISVWELSKVAPERWDTTHVGEIADRNVAMVTQECDLMEALRLLVSAEGQQMLLVTGKDGALEGIVTKTDILRSLNHPPRADSNSQHEREPQPPAGRPQG
jgi:chloride channel protein, CIC family